MKTYLLGKHTAAGSILIYIILKIYFGFGEHQKTELEELVFYIQGWILTAGICWFFFPVFDIYHSWVSGYYQRVNVDGYITRLEKLVGYVKKSKEEQND